MNELWQPYYIWPRGDTQHIDLSGIWDLQFANQVLDNPAKQIDQWSYQAHVPQVVHWSLHAEGVLPHPYYHCNIKDYAWVERKTWYYRCTFEVPNTKRQFAFLCVDGVDYFSRVWLNGQCLGRHEGMFGGPVVEVSDLLHKERPNELILEVQAANYGRADDWEPRHNKGRAIKPWGISRGTSAEAYMTVGLWRPVRLEFVPHTHLERPFLKTLATNDQAAHLELNVEVLCDAHSLQYDLNPWHHCQVGSLRYSDGEWGREQPGDLKKRLDSQAGFSGEVVLEVALIETESGHVAVQQRQPLNLHQGRNWIKRSITVENPRLWWPVGMGDPNLYHVRVTLLEDGAQVDRITFDYGIRTIETRPTAGPQTTDRWADWQFVVNGRPFFVKGINWMPADVLLDLPRDRYRWLLQMAQNAGIQMIRIWGAGLIENDDFYELCDELGIMVWQDFPICNSDSPDWPLDIWQAQVVMNILRLRNHPSLVVWCGGNEFNPYSLGNTAVIGVVERNVALFDGTRVFRRTSPDEGSIHTYPDMDPTWYQYLYARVPYISETGIHSFPEARLLRELVDASEFSQPLAEIFDPSFAESHPELLQHFAEYNPHRVPRMVSRASHIDDVSAPTLETLSEASQIGAGEFYQILSEHLQANYPVTAGLMPWVYKRPHPVIAIQLVDGMGHAGAPYYFLKRTYEPLHVMVQLAHLIWGPGEIMPVRACVLNLTGMQNPADDGFEGTIKVSILDAAFNERWSREATVSVPAAPTTLGVTMDSFEIPALFVDTFFFVIATLRDAAGTLVSRSVYWPRCLSAMQEAAFYMEYRAQPQPALTLDKGPWLKRQVAAQRTALTLAITEQRQLAPDRSVITVTLHNMGHTPAFPVHMDINGAKRAFYATDNYFWLAPGEERRIELQLLWRETPLPQDVRVEAKAWNTERVAAALV